MPSAGASTVPRVPRDRQQPRQMLNAGSHLIGSIDDDAYHFCFVSTVKQHILPTLSNNVQVTDPKLGASTLTDRITLTTGTEAPKLPFDTNMHPKCNTQCESTSRPVEGHREFTSTHEGKAMSFTSIWNRINSLQTTRSNHHWQHFCEVTARFHDIRIAAG